MSKSKLESSKPGISAQVEQNRDLESGSSKRVALEKDCHAMTIGECEFEYDYETILEKVLDEKKLVGRLIEFWLNERLTANKKLKFQMIRRLIIENFS